VSGVTLNLEIVCQYSVCIKKITMASVSSPELVASLAPPPSAASILGIDWLDDYFTKLLVHSFCGCAPPEYNTATTIKILTPLLQFLTIVATRGRTPGVKLSGLDIAEIDSVRLYSYAILRCFAPSAYRAIRQRGMVGMFGNSTALTPKQQLIRERKAWLSKMIQRIADQVVPTVRLLVLLGNWTGLVRGTVSMFLTGITTVQGHKDNSPQLFVDYAHRRWLYENLVQTGRTLLAGYSLLSVWNPLIEAWKNRKLSPKVVAADGCRVCHSNPIMNVVKCYYCAGLYCYTCLYSQSKCVACGKAVSNATFL
jgi:hypothetical protein